MGGMSDDGDTVPLTNAEMAQIDYLRPQKAGFRHLKRLWDYKRKIAYTGLTLLLGAAGGIGGLIAYHNYPTDAQVAANLEKMADAEWEQVSWIGDRNGTPLDANARIYELDPGAPDDIVKAYDVHRANAIELQGIATSLAKGEEIGWERPHDQTAAFFDAYFKNAREWLNK